MEPFSAIVAPLLGFIKFLSPNQSPFVLIFIAVLFCTIAPASGDIDGIRGWLYHIPIYAVIAASVILCFYYEPPELAHFDRSELEFEQTSSPEKLEEKPEIAADLAISIDHQIKFSRSFCLTIGLVCLYVFIDESFENNLTLYSMIYGAILIHMIVFIAYMAFRTLKEESTLRYSIFQIGFLTGLSLLGAALSLEKIQTSDGSTVFQCQTHYVIMEDSREALIRADPENGLKKYGTRFPQRKCDADPTVSATADDLTDTAGETLELTYQFDRTDTVLDWKFVNCLVFLLVWLVFILFWAIRLRKFVRVVVSD